MRKIIFMIMFGVMFFGVYPVQGEDEVLQSDGAVMIDEGGAIMVGDGKIENGSKVTLDYTLSVDGEIVESSEGKAPLEYTHGQSMIIPGLEKALEGLKANDNKKAVIAPENAYGTRDDTRIIEVSKEKIKSDVEPQPGMILQMQNETGQLMSGIIVDIKEDTLTLDLNHPLAGKELTFDVTIVSVN